MPGKKKKEFKITCKQCGETAIRKSSRAIYCTDFCKKRAYESRTGRKTPAFVDVIKTTQKNNFPINKSISKYPIHLQQINEQIENVKELITEQEKRKAAYMRKLQKEYDRIPDDLIKNVSTAVGVGLAIKGISANDDLGDNLLKIFGAGLLFRIAGKNLIYPIFEENQIKKQGEKIAFIKRKIDAINEEKTSLQFDLQNLTKISKEELKKLVNEPEIIRTDNYTEINSKDLKKIGRDIIKLKGKWQYLLGDIEGNFTCLIHGEPKAGKSHLCVQLAQYLKEAHGDVIYISAEEGNNRSFQTKIDRWNANFPIISNASYKGIDQVIKKHNPKFIFIDSLTMLGMTAENVKFYKNEYPEKSFFFITQSNKDGSFKGSQELAHTVDAIIHVKDQQATQKGRTAHGAETFINVFDTDQK